VRSGVFGGKFLQRFNSLEEKEFAMGIRKNQASLTAGEKARFIAAVLQLKANGTYDEYVLQHRNAMNDMARMPAHGGPAFLPWHRELLRRFELDLQRLDPSVTLPYWDWTVDRSPASPLWSSDFMGGDGELGSRRVTTGPFAFAAGRWNLTVASPGDPGPALRRALGQASGLPTVLQVEAALTRVPYDRSPWMGSTQSFRGALETLVHNPVHVWVGGSMAQSTSPNDPVFFLHHCNVDRLWAIWQERHPNERPYLPVAEAMPGHNLNDPMSPWGGATTPASVLDHRSLGYAYDTDAADSIIDLTIGAPATQASIGRAREVDTFRFVVRTAGTYLIETFGPTDVVMSLFGPNSDTALVTEDDDSGEDRNARIVSRLRAGTYFVRVRHYHPASIGSYRISVRSETPQAPIPEIQVNGTAIQGNLEAANESDIYIFRAEASGLYTIATSGNTDTFLTLFGPNSQTRLIVVDDDSGPGLNSMIVADLAPGVYFARVRHFRPDGTGAYRISASR
jgi:tyrosinase